MKSVKYIVLFTVVTCVSAGYGGSDDAMIPPAPVARKPIARPSYVAYPSPQPSYQPPSLPPSDPCLEYPPMFPTDITDGYGAEPMPMRPRYHHRRRHSVNHGSSGGYGNEASYVRPAVMPPAPVDSGYGFVRTKVPRRKVVVDDSYGPQEPAPRPVPPPVISNDGYGDDEAPMVPIAPAPRKPVAPVIEESGYGSYGSGGYGSNVASGSSGY